MHPALVEVPLPALGVPLGPVLGFFAALAALFAYLAFRAQERRTAALAGACGLALLVGALVLARARLLAAPLVVSSWGALFSCSLALAAVLSVRLGVRAGLSREAVTRACVAAALGGIVGARLVWLCLHPSELAWGSLGFYSGGLSVWGGLAGGVVALRLSARRSAAPWATLLDVAAPGFALGVVLTRLGCWLEGCDFGVPLGSAAPSFLGRFGTFPSGSPAWTEHVLLRGLSPSAAVSLPVHPTELYEVVGGFVLVGVALLLTRRQRASGQAFAGTLLGYLLVRATLDGFRNDRVEVWVSRALLLLAILLGAALVTVRKRSLAQK